MEFCKKVNVDPVPVSAYIISLYIAYMADVKRYKFSTIQNYLTIVKHLHRANDYQDPTKDNWLVQHVLKGAKRELGAAQDAATPIEPTHLHTIRRALNLNSVGDLTFWVACLIAFFGFLRPGNFLSESSIFNPARDLSIDALSVVNEDFYLTLTWTKTIQFRERVLVIPLPHMHAHPLCPASALIRLLKMYARKNASPEEPLLQVDLEQNMPLSYKTFIGRLRSILGGAFSGHSFRRGGATSAFRAGMPGELIQDIGFWKSDAYLRYLVTDNDQKLEAVRKLGLSLPLC